MSISLKKIFLILLILLIIGLVVFISFFFVKKFTPLSPFLNQTNQNLNQTSPTTSNNINVNLNINPATLVPLDSDHDGLSDDKEKEIGTDPNNKDTDQDGIIDGAEGGKFLKTDPLNPDTDGDGYKDGEEVLKGYDPTKKDAKIPAGPPPGSAGSKP